MTLMSHWEKASVDRLEKKTKEKATMDLDNTTYIDVNFLFSSLFEQWFTPIYVSMLN